MDPRNLDPSFPHPAGREQRVYVLLDVSHMLKLLRNTFATCRLLKDRRGNIIRWQYLEELHQLQEREGLHLANKLKSAHLCWQSQKMKVKLAAQTLGSSVADALEFCRDALDLAEFKNCQGTVDFLRMTDKLFDVLNSRNKYARGMKGAMKPETEATMSFLDEAHSYIESLTDIADNPMYTTPKRTPFIGFMVATKTVQALYKLYVSERKSLQYLLTYKLSQDHLELRFCAIRAAGGFNNNPTARHFVATFKRLLMRHDIKVVTGSAVPQDHTAVLTPADTGNALKRALEDATQGILVDRRSELMPEDLDDRVSDIPSLLEL